MNPTTPMSFGSGSALLGGATDALSQVMAQRQQGQQGATSAQSPAASGFNPATMSPQMPISQAPAPQSPQPNQEAAPTGGASPMPISSPEAMIILKSFDHRLRSMSKQGK
jgi:hypothetical protein